MSNPEQQVPETPQPIDTTSRALTYLQRLGVTEEELSSEDFNENKIAEKILGNESFTNEYNKSIKTNQDNFLTGKLKKIMSELTGLTDEEVQEDTDFRKIISKGFDKVKTNTNTNVDTLSMEFRTKELQYLSQLEDVKSQLDNEKAKVQSELKDYKVSMKVDSFINTTNLTQTAKANQKEITEMALFAIKKEYDIREKDGLLVLYKGGQPVYKNNTAQITLLEDALELHLDKFGFIKRQEEVKTLTNTSTGGVAQGQQKGWSRNKHFSR